MGKLILYMIGAALVSGCGVKGDPLPPLKPAELGRGRPTYKRASEKVRINERIGENAKPMPTEKKDEDEPER